MLSIVLSQDRYGKDEQNDVYKVLKCNYLFSKSNMSKKYTEFTEWQDSKILSNTVNWHTGKFTVSDKFPNCFPFINTILPLTDGNEQCY